MLFSGCWAVSVEPPVWVWNRRSFDFSSLRPEPLGHDPRPHAAGRPVLGHLLEEVVVGVPEEAQPRGEVVDVQPGGQGGLHVGDAVGEGEGDLLDGRRAGLADVVAGDGDRVPAGQVLRAVGERVGDQPHRRPGRVDVGPPGDVLLQDVVLDGAAQQFRVDPVLLGDQLVEEQQDGGRGVDRHRRRHLVEGQAGQQRPHVGERVDGHAHLADLALGPRVVRVVAHLGGQVEGAGQPGLPRAEQEPQPLVGRLGGAEAGVLADGPEPAPVHVGLDAPGVGEGPGAPAAVAGSQPLEVAGPYTGSDLDAGVGDALRSGWPDAVGCHGHRLRCPRTGKSAAELPDSTRTRRPRAQPAGSAPAPRSGAACTDRRTRR